MIQACPWGQKCTVTYCLILRAFHCVTGSSHPMGSSESCTCSVFEESQSSLSYVLSCPRRQFLYVLIHAHTVKLELLRHLHRTATAYLGAPCCCDSSPCEAMKPRTSKQPSGARSITPFSVMMPWMSSAGVTSKPGFHTCAGQLCRHGCYAEAKLTSI